MSVGQWAARYLLSEGKTLAQHLWPNVTHNSVTISGLYEHRDTSMKNHWEEALSNREGMMMFKFAAYNYLKSVLLLRQARIERLKWRF